MLQVKDPNFMIGATSIRNRRHPEQAIRNREAQSMAALYQDSFVEELRAGAAGLVHEWGLSPRTEVRLLNLSENATFRADDPEAAAPVILRVHRPDYHSRAEIESELAWIQALIADRIVATPPPLETRGGGHIAQFDHHGQVRNVVAFAFMEGQEPAADDGLAEGFRELGEISARLHAHTRAWQRPPGFIRKTWNWETTVGPAPHWGDWRNALGLEAPGRALLERVCMALKDRLAAYGEGPGRFGLVHADLRLANLLADGDRLGVIDFDDCGFGWFVYDFAAAISFIEHEPIVPALKEAWIAGYGTVAPLSMEEVAAIPDFVMLRRLLLTAWIASHAETPTAQELGGPAYTDGTLAIAEAWLGGGTGR
ncbi:phosphotransferase enzyme family protein [Marinibaculum pumilum]|uniref:Phosphotransferase enzyme family protein n=1 Tax=Marinibaculum pumilum TaxID=1766165 RepID=A0ABV7L9W3_9PROT